MFEVRRSVIVMTVLIIGLTAVVSGIGVLSMDEVVTEVFISVRGEAVELFNSGIYEYDSKKLGLQLIAQDFVNLVVGIPLLIVGLLLYLKKNVKGYLILVGTYGYFIYTFMGYSFGVQLNPLFLFYVGLTSLSFFGTIVLTTSGNTEAIKNVFKDNTPNRLFGGIQIVLSILFIIIWMERIIPTMFGDYITSHIEHYTSLGIQVLDLAFVIPLAIISGIEIWEKKARGYVLTAFMLIKFTTLFVAISAMVLIQEIYGIPQDLVESVIFGAFGMLFVGCFALLLICVNGNEKKQAFNI